MERLAAEHQAVGFYLSGHPLDDYAGPLRRKDVLTLAEVTRRAEGGGFVGKIAGAVSSRQERKSARGNRFAFVQLSDSTGLYEVTVFSDVLEAARAHLEPGSTVVLSVEATMEADTLKLLARSVQPVDVAVADAGAAGLRVRIAEGAVLPELAEVLDRHRDQPVSRKACGPLWFCIPDPASGDLIEVEIGRDLPVTPRLRGELRVLPGILDVEEV
jgi:DNA polymerase III subunit alpha